MKNKHALIFQVALILLISLPMFSQDRGGLTTLDKKPDSPPDEMTIALKKKLTYDWQLHDNFDRPIPNWTLYLREDGTFVSSSWDFIKGMTFEPLFKPRPTSGTWDVEHHGKFTLVLKYPGGQPDFRMDIEFTSADKFTFPTKDENTGKESFPLSFTRKLSIKETEAKFKNKGFYFNKFWDVKLRGTGTNLESTKLKSPKKPITLVFKNDMTYFWKEGYQNEGYFTKESFWTFDKKDGQCFINADKLGNYLVLKYEDKENDEVITLEMETTSGEKEYLVLSHDKSF